jgi:hypothetical protein
MLAHLTPPRRASDPSPGPRRLVKAPAAVHPLPSGEGKDAIPSLSPRETGRSQRSDGFVQRKMWDTLRACDFFECARKLALKTKALRTSKGLVNQKKSQALSKGGEGGRPLGREWGTLI